MVNQLMEAIHKAKERERKQSLPRDFDAPPLIKKITQARSSAGRGGGGGGTSTPTPVYTSDLLKQSFISQSAMRQAETAHKLQQAKTTALEKFKQITSRPTTISQMIEANQTAAAQKSLIMGAKTIKDIPELTYTPPQRGTIMDQPRKEYIPEYKGYKLTPAKVATIAATGVSTVSRKFPEYVEKQWEDIARAAGVPEGEVDVTIPIAKKETIIFEPPSTGSDIDILNLKPTKEQLYAEEKVRIGPEAIGRAAGGVVGFGQYVVPIWGPTVIGAEVVKGVETFKTPIPTKAEIIKEQTVDLSSKERKDWLTTVEGKKFEKEVEDYRGSLQKQKLLGLGTAVAGVGILGAPVVFRGLKYVREPIKTVVKPSQVLTAPSKVGIYTMGEEAVGVKVGGTLTTEEIATFQPRWSKWLKQEPKIFGVEKPKIDVTAQVFKLEKDKAVSWVVEARAGEQSTLRKLSQTFEVTAPKKIADLSKLPKVSRYVASKLPPRQLAEGTTSYLGISQTVKGVPTTKSIVRLERASDTQRQLRVLTRPPTPKEAPFGLSFIRVKPVKIPTPKDVQVFVSETGTKLTKSFQPRATGKVEVEQAVTYVKEFPKPSKVDFVGTRIKGSPKTALVKQQQKLVARAAQVTAKAPKPKVPKPKPLLEPKPVAPPIVRGVSRFYGKGTYEVTDAPAGPITSQFTVPVTVVAPTTTITPKVIPSQVLDVPKTQPTVYTPLAYKPKEGVVVIPKPKVTEVEVEIGVLKEKEREKIRTLQRTFPREETKQPLAFKEKVGTAQKTSLKVDEILLRPKPIITPRPTRPRPPFRPKPPTTPVLLPPSDPVRPKKVKKKLVEELVTPFVRRRGKFFAIGPATTKQKALKKGVTRLRGTLAASLELRKKSGERVKFAKETREFRRGAGKSPFTLVQRAPKRLGRREEIAEIIASRRAGVGKFI